MEIAELQRRVDEWIRDVGVRYFSELTNMAVLTEEVGELARVMARRYGDQSFKAGEKDDLADEMADVLWVWYVWPTRREWISQPPSKPTSRKRAPATASVTRTIPSSKQRGIIKFPFYHSLGVPVWETTLSRLFCVARTVRRSTRTTTRPYGQQRRDNDILRQQRGRERHRSRQSEYPPNLHPEPILALDYQRMKDSDNKESRHAYYKSREIHLQNLLFRIRYRYPCRIASAHSHNSDALYLCGIDAAEEFQCRGERRAERFAVEKKFQLLVIRNDEFPVDDSKHRHISQTSSMLLPS